jgi:hypothetical protein
MNPFKFLILILIIVLSQFGQSILVPFTESDDMTDALDNENRYIGSLDSDSEPASLIHPETAHEHNTQHSHETDIQIELVALDEFFIQKVGKRKGKYN